MRVHGFISTPHNTPWPGVGIKGLVKFDRP
jgi:hypothetical protein